MKDKLEKSLQVCVENKDGESFVAICNLAGLERLGNISVNEMSVIYFLESFSPDVKYPLVLAKQSVKKRDYSGLIFNYYQNKNRLHNEAIQFIETLFKSEIDDCLILSGCTKLVALPKNLSVSDSLILDGCTNLVSLPSKLKIGGYLELSDCVSLTSLPNNLRIKDHLSLSGCTGLTSLPRSLQVENSIFLDGCINLKTVPKHLKSLCKRTPPGVKFV
jgi:hypothetical protein